MNDVFCRPWCRVPLALPVLLVVLVLLSATRQPAHADEPASLALFADNSFAAWDYGAVDNVTGEPAGWTIKARQLSGSQGAASLLSGFTLGDFELRFAWQVSPGGSCKLLLPVTSKPAADVPDRYASPRWELTLREGDSCGTLVDNWGVHAAGGTVAAGDGKPHATVLRRAGNKFALAVDGHQLYEIEIRPELRFGLGLEVAAGQATIDDLRLSEPAGEPLIAPGQFGGWWSPRGMRAWKWERDELVCRGSGGDYLRTEREWENFTLTFDYKLGQRGNSGIGIRTPREGWPSGDGIELQLYDELPDAPLNRHSTMALYGNLEPLARGDRRDEWNHAVVRAEGYVVSAWVNGALVQHGNTWRLSELKYRHLKGWIGLQDHGGRVRFRDVRATELPSGRGPAEWYQARHEPAALAVLDRLMNPLRAASDDGIRSQVARKVVEATNADDEVVLASFTGLGAVTTVVVPDPNEQLAWYFDGEAQPRLTCTAAELIHRVPCIDHEMWPPIVWIPFERELKIVRPPVTASADARRAAGEFRVESASLPSSLPVRSWSPDRVDVPRGLLSACSYRFHQMDSGRLRELSPAAAHASPRRRLNAGERADVLNIPGAGVAQWLSLAAPASALAADDLWIELAVDGEAQPSLAAPARYWFPGVAARKGWHNFVITADEVLLSGDLYTNRLAIPFAAGLQVALVNRGDKAIESLSASTSIISAGDPLLVPGVPKRRLRGLFASESSASAGAAGTDTPSGFRIDLEGNARLVGIVCQSAEDAMPRVAALAIDGQPQPAWSGYPLADASAQAAAPLFQPLAGRAAGVAWRHALLAPIDFRRSLAFEIEPRPKSTWLLYYVEP